MSDSDDDDDRSRIFKGVKFFLHQSFSFAQLEVLTRKIKRHGGTVLENLDGRTADTIIVSDDSPARPGLVDRYRDSKKTWVENPHFINRCIQRRKYSHGPVPVKGLGGRHPGGIRNNFTEDEDIRLAQFIASMIPDKEAGGRLGQNIYKYLTSSFLDNGERRYEWSTTHPWQAWRERYKKNQKRFDAMIDAILQVDPPEKNGKGQYPYRRGGMVVYQLEEEDEEEEEEGDRARTRRRSPRPSNDTPPRKRPRNAEDERPASQKSPRRTQRERTAEAQLAGPSGHPREAETRQFDEFDEAPFTIDVDYEVAHPDLEMPTQATLVQPPSTNDKGKQREEPSSPPSPPSPSQGYRAPTTKRFIEVVIDVSPSPPNASMSRSQPVRLVTPEHDLATRPLSMSSPTLSKSARKTPLSSATMSAARNRDDDEEEDSEESEDDGDVPFELPTPPRKEAETVKINATSVAPVIVDSSDAPYRNTRARSKSVEPEPLPMPSRRGNTRAFARETIDEEETDDDDDEEQRGDESSASDIVQGFEIIRDDREELADVTAKSVNTRGNHTEDLDEVEMALTAAEGEEEEADSQAATSDSDSDSDDASLLEAVQHGARALLSNRMGAALPQLRYETPGVVEGGVIFAESGRRSKQNLVNDEIQLGFRDYVSSTSDEFRPSPGTRALEERKRRKEDVRKGRYNPPQGTKAEMRNRNLYSNN